PIDSRDRRTSRKQKFSCGPVPQGIAFPRERKPDEAGRPARVQAQWRPFLIRPNRRRSTRMHLNVSRLAIGIAAALLNVALVPSTLAAENADTQAQAQVEGSTTPEAVEDKEVGTLD